MHTEDLFNMMDDEQRKALELMLDGKNVFLTGFAGTGKSLVINMFKQLCTKRLVCLAPTGQAARNIEGSTIHRFFRFKVDPIITLDSALVDDRQLELLNNVDVILIDEVSMVRADLFQGIDVLLRTHACGPCRNLPFAGKQIIVVGDYCQLPPVVPDTKILQFLQDEFGGIYALSTPAWLQAGFESVLLHQIHRQAEPCFQGILTDIRNGKIKEPTYPDIDSCHSIEDLFATTEDDCLSMLNQRCFFRSVHNADDNNMTVTICMTRAQAQLINWLELDFAPGEQFSFKANTCGTFPRDEYPVEENLTLKVGARVMLIANQHSLFTEKNYVNGDAGRIIDFTYDPDMVRVELDSGRIVEVVPYTWEYKSYEILRDTDGKAKIETEICGWFTQMPIIISAGLTVHRLQGATVNSNVKIVLGPYGAFCPWQFYVAASRCCKIDQLHLDRPVMPSDIIVDHKILDFYRRLI